MRVSLPNIISLIRLVGSPLIPVLIAMDAPTAAFVYAGLLAFSDALDGYIAKRWNQITETGKLLDVWADFSFGACTFLALVIMYEHVPALRLFWTIIGLHFAWYAFEARRLRNAGKVNSPSMLAKIKTALLMGAMLMAMAPLARRPEWWDMAAFLIAAAAGIMAEAALDHYRTAASKIDPSRPR